MECQLKMLKNDLVKHKLGQKWIDKLVKLEMSYKESLDIFDKIYKQKDQILNHKIISNENEKLEGLEKVILQNLISNQQEQKLKLEQNDQNIDISKETSESDQSENFYPSNRLKQYQYKCKVKRKSSRKKIFANQKSKYQGDFTIENTSNYNKIDKEIFYSEPFSKQISSSNLQEEEISEITEDFMRKSIQEIEEQQEIKEKFLYHKEFEAQKNFQDNFKIVVNVQVQNVDEDLLEIKEDHQQTEEYQEEEEKVKEEKRIRKLDDNKIEIVKEDLEDLIDLMEFETVVVDQKSQPNHQENNTDLPIKLKQEVENINTNGFEEDLDLLALDLSPKYQSIQDPQSQLENQVQSEQKDEQNDLILINLGIFEDSLENKTLKSENQLKNEDKYNFSLDRQYHLCQENMNERQPKQFEMLEKQLISNSKSECMKLQIQKQKDLPNYSSQSLKALRKTTSLEFLPQKQHFPVYRIENKDKYNFKTTFNYSTQNLYNTNFEPQVMSIFQKKSDKQQIKENTFSDLDHLI